LALCGVGLRAEAADSLDADVIGETKCETRSISALGSSPPMSR